MGAALGVTQLSGLDRWCGRRGYAQGRRQEVRQNFSRLHTLRIRLR